MPLVLAAVEKNTRDATENDYAGSLLSKLALSMADYRLKPVGIKLLRPRAKAQRPPRGGVGALCELGVLAREQESLVWGLVRERAIHEQKNQALAARSRAFQA